MTTPEGERSLDLMNPLHLRAEMGRAGIAPAQLYPWESPDNGYTNPLNDPELQAAVRHFMLRLWEAACTDGSTRQQTGNDMSTTTELRDFMRWRSEQLVSGEETGDDAEQLLVALRQYADQYLELSTELSTAESRLEAVKALHADENRRGHVGRTGGWCNTCNKPHPCPTYRAASSSDLPEGDTNMKSEPHGLIVSCDDGTFSVEVVCPDVALGERRPCAVWADDTGKERLNECTFHQASECMDVSEWLLGQYTFPAVVITEGGSGDDWHARFAEGSP